VAAGKYRNDAHDQKDDRDDAQWNPEGAKHPQPAPVDYVREFENDEHDSQ